MGIKVNVQWKFKVNGKEYGSVEEMRANIREAYKRAKGTSRIAATKVIFNGQEYESVEAMPQDVLHVYERVLKGAETGEIPAEALSGAEFGTRTHVHPGKSAARATYTPRPIEPESILTPSPRTLIVGSALLILLIGLYYVMVR